MQYITVAAGETDQVLSGNNSGKKHDYIQRLIIAVNAVGAGGACTLKDGSTSITITSASVPINTYHIEMEVYSKTGAWSITTGANVDVIAVGNFD